MTASRVACPAWPVTSRRISRGTWGGDALVLAVPVTYDGALHMAFSFDPGQVVAGKYRVERIIGRGGMGFVVAATHVDLREPRALKFMLPENLEDPEAVERFLREARAASRLKGEHVARVFDVARLDEGAPYLVMEYLEGRDLQAEIRERGAIPPRELALYLIQAFEALAEAHARGIIHRDLKAGNLF